MAKDVVQPFDDQISIKCEPELRHVLIHLFYAVECLAAGCPIGCLDNLRSVEGLLAFDGDGPDEWEAFYREQYRNGRLKGERWKWVRHWLMDQKKKEKRQMKKKKKSCHGKKKSCHGKKCKGKKCKGKMKKCKGKK